MTEKTPDAEGPEITRDEAARQLLALPGIQTAIHAGIEAYVAALEVEGPHSRRLGMLNPEIAKHLLRSVIWYIDCISEIPIVRSEKLEDPEGTCYEGSVTFGAEVTGMQRTQQFRTFVRVNDRNALDQELTAISLQGKRPSTVLQHTETIVELHVYSQVVLRRSQGRGIAVERALGITIAFDRFGQIHSIRALNTDKFTPSLPGESQSLEYESLIPLSPEAQNLIFPRLVAVVS